MVFFPEALDLAITNVLYFWFAVEIFKIQRQVWIFINIFDCFEFNRPPISCGKDIHRLSLLYKKI
jgi:hypothetical protein